MCLVKNLNCNSSEFIFHRKTRLNELNATFLRQQ